MGPFGGLVMSALVGRGRVWFAGLRKGCVLGGRKRPSKCAERC